MSYFTDLGLYSNEAPFGARGTIAAKRRNWMLAIYASLTLGIFLRQISAFPVIDLRVENVRWAVLLASAVVGAVILPPMTRWISKRHRGRPNVEHVLWALTYGFFSDLLMKAVLAQVAALVS